MVGWEGGNIYTIGFKSCLSSTPIVSWFSVPLLLLRYPKRRMTPDEDGVWFGVRPKTKIIDVLLWVCGKHRSPEWRAWSLERVSEPMQRGVGGVDDFSNYWLVA